MVAEPGFGQRSSRDLADPRMNVAPSSAQLPSHEEAAVTTNSTAGGVYTFPTPYEVVKNNDALLESGPSSRNSCREFPSSGKQRMKSKKRSSASSRDTQPEDEGSCFTGTASKFPGIVEECVNPVRLQVSHQVLHDIRLPCSDIRLHYATSECRV
jgi:hypothetical protein